MRKIEITADQYKVIALRVCGDGIGASRIPTSRTSFASCPSCLSRAAAERGRLA
jgi:hypothetical protein